MSAHLPVVGITALALSIIPSFALGSSLDVADWNIQADDPDLDLLVTSQEYAYGTDPLNSDSDGGGENDGSEVDHSQNPLDPSDDEIEALAWIRAHAADAAVILNFDAKPEYVVLWLYRASRGSPDFELVNASVPPIGSYTDGGLINGRDYYYRMTAIDAGGHRSRVTPTVRALPSTNAVFFDGFELTDTSAWSGVSP